MTRKQIEEAKFEAFSVMCEKVNELEKENAELKEKLGDVQMQKAGEKSDLVWKLKTANEQKADQLTEAKKVIEELYNIIPASMADYAKEPMEHARKFMTEE